jgi:TolC family type I secretion outer membrane protein
MPALPAGTDLSKPQSLTDCARLALALNPSLAVAGKQVTQASASVVQARAALLPSLSLGADLAASQSLTPSGGGATGGGFTGGGRSTNRDVSLTLNQTFFRSGLIQQIAAARASALAARWGFHDARRTLLLNVAQGYYAVLAATALADVAHQSVKAATVHLDAANTRIQAGTAAKSDRYPFEVQLQQALVQAISAENQITLSLNNLKEIMGLPATVSLRLAESLGRPAPPDNLDELRAQAMQNRPDVAQRRAQVEASRQQAQAAEIQRGPVLTASGSDDYGSHTNAQGNAWQVQVGVSLPIFDAGATRAAADSARAGLDIARENLRQTELGASAEVENNFATALQANQQIDVAQAATNAAQISLQAAEEKYAAGLGTVLDVTDAELKLRQAQSDEVQARYNYNTALAALRASVGQPAVEGLGS